MDKTKNDQVKKKKVFKDIDIRDVVHYLLTKSWVIVIVVAVCLVAAILYTAFITPTYDSSSSMIIITDEGTTTQDFSAGQQIINNTPEVIKGNVFCNKIADTLNNKESYHALLNANPALVKALGGDKAYDYENASAYNNNLKLSASTIQGSLNVNISNTAKNTFTVTSTTKSPELSCIIANTATYLYQDYVETEIVPEGTSLQSDIYKSGSVPVKAANKNFPKNVAIAVAVGAIVTCAILFVIFFFDDKIKTPDDIEKHLELNILGTIPDFEER